MIHIGAVEVLIRWRLVGKMFGITSTVLYEQIHVSGGGKIGAYPHGNCICHFHEQSQPLQLMNMLSF